MDADFTNWRMIFFCGLEWKLDVPNYRLAIFFINSQSKVV